MKTVLLLRHGKSKRGPQYATDYERPLAGRGKRDAYRMGEFLVEREIVPHLILSSPAERARQTALRCVEAADYQGELRFQESLYFSGEGAYLELLWELDDSLGSVLFVGHNPDIESLVETFCNRYVRMPTAALVRIDLDVESWADVYEGGGKLAWVQLPREL
jgi:phosphohistidine phosphatase